MADESLAEIATAVADGASVDWGSASETLRSPDDLDLLDGLKLVADLTRARGVHLQPPPSTADDAPLEEWGPLRVIERVGHGTFGDVYKAWDTRLDREVALKVLHRVESQTEPLPVAIEEGRLLARVSHPNVVTVYGAERVKGQVGVWMEFVHGSTLETELRERGPFPSQSVIDIAIQLGDALSAVHRAGILHRDVKTQNVMRDGDGRLLLTDFGACELLQSPSEPVKSSIGTPLCTAPEVIEGHRATPQSDVYSLGVLLYRLATERYPVEGRTLEDVRVAHAQGTRVAIRDARTDLPEPLADLIERAIHPNRARRFQTADELRDGFAALIQPATARARVSKPLRVLISAALLLAGLSVFLTWREPRPVTIAVLPLQNLGSGTNSEELADGLTTELIRHLATVPGLDVRSRTSSFVFKDRPRNLRDAGEQLQASLLLEGSVHHVGDRIRITAHLVRAEDDATVWAGKFDRDVSAISTIQDEISRAIVNELRLKLGRSDRRYNIDVATYERYLRARSLSARPDRESLRTAIAFYNEVTATQPGFAPAYAALADAYADLEFSGVNYEDTYLQIKAAASKAIDLDPELPEAHAAMGLVHARDRRWDQARAAFERSVALNPNLSRTRTAYAHWYLFQTGQLARALEELRTALSHDPLSLNIRRLMAYVQVSAGDYDAALENCNYVLKVDPKYPLLIGLVKSRALLMKGQTAEAVAILEAMPPNRAPELGYAYAVTNRRAEAEALADAAANVPLTQAIIYTGLGDHNRAFAALERGAAAGDPKIGGVLTYPEMIALRQDPRFEALRRQIGLGTK